MGGGVDTTPASRRKGHNENSSRTKIRSAIRHQERDKCDHSLCINLMQYLGWLALCWLIRRRKRQCHS
jgi:hypothetical protein